MMARLLQKYLYSLAKITLWHHKPRIIAITGNVGKTSAKEAIYAVLSPKFSVRKGEKNYNNEIGVPLTILGEHHHGKNVFAWAFMFIRVLFRVFFRAHEYPRILVLEMGADKPGDIEYLTKLARPDVAVITGVGEIPVHVEFFKTPEAVAEEKANLVRAVSSSGLVILNADDPRVLVMKALSRSPVFTYGTSDNADARPEHIEVRFREEGGMKIPEGLAFKISYKGSVLPIRLNGSLGMPQVLAATAAFLVAALEGVNGVEITSALAGYYPPPGRMRIIQGIKQSLILDDTYNASPSATEAALKTLAELPGGRKIAVLGDTLELGSYTEEAHRKIGRLAVATVQVLVAVGPRAKFIADEALAGGFDPQNVFYVLDAREVETILQPLIQSGDVILIKGSQGMRMERVVEAIMAEPEKAGELLVRQSVDWKEKM